MVNSQTSHSIIVHGCPMTSSSAYPVSVSKATIYNTLGLFASKGLLREVIVDPSRVFYDSNTGHHHHFFNVDSGTLSDIQADQLPIGDLPSLPEGTEVDGVDVIVRVRNQSA